jgi:hypothetical protein
MATEPLLSVIVVAPEGWDPVRTTVRHLAAQSVADRIEVVFVLSRDTPFDLETDAVASFASNQAHRLDSIPSYAAGYAAGVRRASAPIVAFAEDHCFPERDWAEALLAAYDDRTAVVGPQVIHANDEGVIAWSEYLLGYGQWVAPETGGEVTNVAGHNSSYRRDALLDFGPELGEWLDVENLLQGKLREKGWRVVLAPEARSHHFSISRLRSWITVTFLQYRMFGGRRLASAGLLKRAFYIVAMPLVPVIRLRRSLRDARRARVAPPLYQLVPSLCFSLTVSAIGEAVGYALGPGNAPQALRRYEFRRDRHLNERDLRKIQNARYWE